MPPPLAELGKVAAGPPAFELPPAVLPAFCAIANVLVKANAAAKTIVFDFMVVSSTQIVAPKGNRAKRIKFLLL
jgi:hypothetical protein